MAMMMLCRDQCVRLSEHLVLERLTYFAKVILSEVRKVVWPRYASEGKGVCGLALRFETKASLENFEQVKQTQVI